jgi:hypothetical protein
MNLFYPLFLNKDFFTISDEVTKKLFFKSTANKNKE